MGSLWMGIVASVVTMRVWLGAMLAVVGFVCSAEGQVLVVNSILGCNSYLPMVWVSCQSESSEPQEERSHLNLQWQGSVRTCLSVSDQRIQKRNA